MKNPFNTIIDQSTVGREDVRTILFNPGRYFFVTMSFIFVIISLVGFVPIYHTMIEGTKRFPIHWLAHVHGAIMMLWLLMFTTQSILAAKGSIKLHRQLGLQAVGLGILVWVSMWVASGRALIGFNPPKGHFLFDVLIIQLYGIILFGLFFTWGILRRKNAAVHKRLLFLSTLVLLQAPIDRMFWLPGLHMALYIRFFYLDVLLLPLFLYDWIMLKRLHPVTTIGAVFFLAVQAAVVTIWGSTSWHSFWFNLMNWFS